MRHHLALVACLAFTGSVVHAAPGRHGKPAKKAKPRVKVAPPIEAPEANDEDRDDDVVVDDDDDDEDEAPRRTKRAERKGARAAHAREQTASQRERVAFRGEATDDDDAAAALDEQDMDDADRAEVVDPPVRVRSTAGPRAKEWHVAFGPYLWASSVDADVSLGSASVSSGVDFFELQRHARYGAEVLAEASYGRFSIYGDLMYGVVDLDGGNTVGPLMVTLDGTASSLLVDGAAGYRLAGDDHARLSLEARAGVRYQRTAVGGSLAVAGAAVTAARHVDAAADALAGVHVVVRPFRRLALSGTFDLGVFGESTNTWSALADASVRITSHVLLSLGWRTLTTQRANVSIVMHGPRAAVRLLF